MEPLSKPLTDWLLRLNLASPADLRRAKGRVRQLARDLPAFDSVWIDALVHAKKLTAFQARLLESGRPNQLAVGPWVLVDQLGHGTYLARERNRQQRSVLKRIGLDEEFRGPAFHALKDLIARGNNLSHAGVIVPKSCLLHGEELISISDYALGPTLSQLLVRRGRFPTRVVSALAKQLIDSLAALEEQGILHGDLQLGNLRLSSSGRVVMVDAGVAPAIRPVLNIHARVPPERYDGIAPELISTGNLANSQSEFYALGCLLWQLLAGRPPYPTGDPLAKLMAHRTRRIPDVREIAPDTPKELAESIRSFTEPDPENRPPSFQAFREAFGKPRLGHRRRLARFRAAFSTAIPHVPAMRPLANSNRWPVVAGLMFLLTGASLCLMDAGAYSRLLAIPSRLEEMLNEADAALANDKETDESNAIEKARPLPEPDADGLIELTDAGPYELGSMETVGPLTIRGGADLPAELIISQTPGRLSATEILLENLRLRLVHGDSAKIPSMIEAASRQLIVRNCEFQLGHKSPVAIQWRNINPHHAARSRVGFENLHVNGTGGLCRFEDWPSLIAVKNCLKSGTGPLMAFSQEGQSHRGIEFQLSQLTLRQGSGLFLVELGPKSPPGAWMIHAEDSVFDLEENSAGLFQLQGPGAANFLKSLQMQGRQCLLNRSAQVAGWRHSESQPFEPVDGSSVNVEGMVLAGLTFAGKFDNDPAASVLESWEGPRFSSSQPGIDPSSWPVWMTEPW